MLNLNPTLQSPSSLETISQVENSNIDFVNIESLDNLDFTALENSALNFLSSAYDKHNFLRNVLKDENKDDMSPEMLREIQNNLEKFTVQTQLIGKTVSIALKDIDTLTRLQ